MCQASPSDPENFPFVVLGNKVDIDGGNSRVVRFLVFPVGIAPSKLILTYQLRRYESGLVKNVVSVFYFHAFLLCGF